MKFSFFGSFYVGLVAATSLTDAGDDVLCVDIDTDEVARLRQGQIPNYEPGLTELVLKNAAEGRLRFITNAAAGVAGLYQFIAVGTPPSEDGSADLQYVLAAARSISLHKSEYRAIVSKSTEPVGASDSMLGAVREVPADRSARPEFDTVSDPEFLKEGDAIADFNKSNRIIVGGNSPRAAKLMRVLCATPMRLHRLLPLLLGVFAAQLAVPAPVQAAAKAAAPPPLAAAAHPLLPPCRAQTSLLPSGIPVLRDCEGAPEMIVLRGGGYLMGGQLGDGETYEQPHHVVQIRPVAIGRFEVTNGEWDLCVKAGGCSPSHLPVGAGHGRYPVAGVSWIQVKAYADWLAARTGKSYRLPSESEWEYAARAGDSSSSPWTTFDLDPCSRANMLDASGRREHPDWTWAETCDDHFAGAAPVGSFPPNDWGFHDMLGNVWEWVADCWHSDYTGAPTDGSVWQGSVCNKYVNRGGGWGNNLLALRFSSRDADPGRGYSDGLGFRIARSIGSGELPADPVAMPDTRPRSSETTPAATAPRAVGAESAQAANPPSAAALPPPATSLATERQFELHITAEGSQTWKYALQHTQGSTRQDFVLSTRLHSDGILYGDNLLDLDQETRLAVKNQYLARRGLILVKAMNKGKLPHTAEEISAVTAKVQAGMLNCLTQQDCSGDAVELSAALGALQNNRAEDLDALIAAPATGLAARWLYFFGYAGCPNSIHISSDTHIAGERAYNRTKTSRGLPWALDSSANTGGNAEDRATLCQRYTATVDIRNGDVYLENLYIPAIPGTIVRSFDGRVERSDEDLPVSSEMLNWSNAKLRRTHETANYSEALAANAPFDENYTFLGQYFGTLQTTMSWSFLPVAGAPLAVVPLLAPPR